MRFKIFSRPLLLANLALLLPSATSASTATAPQNQVIVSSGDPTAWEFWTSGTLSVEKRDRNNQSKSLILRFHARADADPQSVTLSTDTWNVDLTSEVSTLANPVFGRLKLRADLNEMGLFDEVIVRIPFHTPVSATGDYDCKSLELDLKGGSVFDMHVISEDRRSCEQ